LVREFSKNERHQKASTKQNLLITHENEIYFTILRTLTRITILLAIALLALCASPAVALADGCIAQTNWVDGNGDWFNPANWDNGVPTASASAQINHGDTANIGRAGAVACELFLGFSATNSGSVSVNAGTLVVGTEIEVGGFGTGKLSITNGGSVSAGLLTIAALSSGAIGTVSVDGSTFTTTGRCDVGGDDGTDGGVALLGVTSGATVSAGSVHVHKSGTLTGNGTVNVGSGSGTATVDGTVAPNWTLTITGNLTFSNTAASMQCNITPANLGSTDAHVTGGARLNGRLSVTMTGTFTPGTTYILLKADGSLGNTQFFSDSITFPTGQNFTPEIIYDTNDVKLYLAANTGP
jgi:T5SS/PEP-CTERM-associated repeat protein